MNEHKSAYIWASGRPTIQVSFVLIAQMAVGENFLQVGEFIDPHDAQSEQEKLEGWPKQHSFIRRITKLSELVQFLNVR